jgi:hypothetical protein
VRVRVEEPLMLPEPSNVADGENARVAVPEILLLETAQPVKSAARILPDLFVLAVG